MRQNFGANQMAENVTSRTAHANPTKTFFVKMITRDILLEDCILDLIDNSIDGALRSEGSHTMGPTEGTDLSKYAIYLDLSPDAFTIRDNCGGMTLDDAVNHAFSFGRRASEPGHDYSIGIYGIGMKRAIFKLGNDIRIRSTFIEGGSQCVNFAVPIDVAKWVSKDDPPWDFDIDSDDGLDTPGVEIRVKSLTPGATSSFGNPTFKQNLRRIIGRDYTLYLSRGLSIILNGEKIPEAQIQLRDGGEFSPMRISHEDTEEPSVSIELICGMAAPPPESSEPDEQDDSDKRYGWYVACNGRIVLAADKTAISGWGTADWPIWHRQYSGFIGLILFTAPNALALPLTTTKRSVDTASEVFRRAQPLMREATKKWIAYTNQRKQALDEAKKKEGAATPVSIFTVSRRESVRLPALNVTNVPTPANVHYAVPVDKMKKLASAFGSINLSYRDVGIKSFEHAYADLVGDE